MRWYLALGGTLLAAVANVACGGDASGTGGGGGAAAAGGSDAWSVAFATPEGIALEDGGPYATTLVLSTTAPLGEDVSVEVVDVAGTAMAGSDYAPVMSMMTFPAGSQDGATLPLSVDIFDDGDVEGDEAFSLEVVDATHTVTIAEGDVPTVTFVAPVVAAENGTVAIDVSLTIPDGGAAGEDVVVDVVDLGTGDATAGTDYTVSAQLTFPSGTQSTELPVTITIAADLEREANETIDLGLTVVSGFAVAEPDTGVVTIQDDDALTSLSAAFASTYDPGTALSTKSGVGALSAPFGAAYDPNTHTLYVRSSSVGSDDLHAIDIATDTVTHVGTIGFEVRGLAFDPGANKLYGVGQDEVLIDIDTSTGIGMAIGGGLGSGNWDSLAFDPGAGVLYTVDAAAGGALYSVDPTLGTATLIGSTGMADVVGLAFDSSTSTLYASRASSVEKALYTLDASSGSPTLVGAYPDQTSNVGALAFDPTSGTLFGFDSSDRALWDIDTSTAAFGWIRALSADQVWGTAFDSVTGVHYGVDRLNRALVAFHSDGTFTTIGQVDAPGIVVRGLAYNAAQTVLYAYASNNDELYAIDPTTAEATTLGILGAGEEFQGLAYDNSSGTLYGITGAGDIWQIDPGLATASALVLNPTPQSLYGGLATDELGTLYSHRLGTLVSIDLDANYVELGPSGGGAIYALAFDTSTTTLHALVNLWGVATIDTATGRLTTAGWLPGFDAAAHDPGNDVFYAARDEDGLWTVAPDASSATFVGALGSPCRGLAFVTTTLYCADSSLFIVNVATAGQTLINPITPSVGIESLAWDPNGGVLYGASEDFLYRIDVASAGATQVGFHGIDAPVDIGLTYDPNNDVLYAGAYELFILDVNTAAATSVGEAHSYVSALAFADP